MEIPRVLAVGNVAVRLMNTKYDHLSPLSKSFYPKRKVKPPDVIVEEAPAGEEANADGVRSFLCEVIVTIWLELSHSISRVKSVLEYKISKSPVLCWYIELCNLL